MAEQHGGFINQVAINAAKQAREAGANVSTTETEVGKTIVVHPPIEGGGFEAPKEEPPKETAPTETAPTT